MDEYDTFKPIYTEEQLDMIKIFYILKGEYEEGLRKQNY